MDKIDIRDMILRTLKDNKIEVDNFNDAVFEDDFLKVAETIVKNLALSGVSQQRELLDFVKDVAETRGNSTSTRLRLKAQAFLKSNCG